MFRRSQNEDETEILAVPSEEILSVAGNGDNLTLSKQSVVRGFAENKNLSEVPCWGVRHTFVLLACLGLANVYAMRVNLSVAIVAMVNHTAIDHLHNSSNLLETRVYYLDLTPNTHPISYHTDHSIMSNDTTCPSNITSIPPVDNGTDPNLPDGPFVWDESMQSVILGSFFYGYVITQIPAGYLVGQQLVSSKWLLAVGILMTSIFTVLMPWAANTNYYFLIAIRVLEGMSEGVTFPVIHSMLARWSPPLERSRMSTYVYSGAPIGVVISTAVTGEICNHLGWKSVFYIFGGFGIVWFIFWSFLAFDDPISHPYITKAEKDLIEIVLGNGRSVSNEMIESQSQFSSVVQDTSSLNQGPHEDNSQSLENTDCDITTNEISSTQEETSIEAVETTTLSRHHEKKESRSIPWKDIFTSKPVWAIFFCNILQTYGSCMYLTELPKYLMKILRYNLNEASIVAALPGAFSYAFSITASWIADTILIKQWMSRTNTRKLMVFIASVFPTIGLVISAFLGSDANLFIVMLCLATGFNGFQGSGSNVNIIDISPNYAGAVMGVANTAASSMGFVAPYVLGVLLSAGDDHKHWQIVFFLASGGYFIGGVIYMMLASGEIQYWNDATAQMKKTMGEFERDANLRRNQEHHGPIMSADFNMSDDDLIG